MGELSFVVEGQVVETVKSCYSNSFFVVNIMYKSRVGTTEPEGSVHIVTSTCKSQRHVGCCDRDKTTD